jgi:hypothetical protein
VTIVRGADSKGSVEWLLTVQVESRAVARAHYECFSGIGSSGTCGVYGAHGELEHNALGGGTTQRLDTISRSPEIIYTD